MTIKTERIRVYRIIPIENLEEDLSQGFFSKQNAPNSPNRVVIGNETIIAERDKRPVKCYPTTVVNEYVPFYFSVRTPMLYNIHTGHGVPKRHQRDIIYLSGPILALANNNFQWCFTDGNAAKKITRFYSDLGDLDKIDWRSIRSHDFRIDNSDGDEDRVRKKHAEFLVKDHVPSNKIDTVVVFNKAVKSEVEQIIKRCPLNINVLVNPNGKFYF